MNDKNESTMSVCYFIGGIASEGMKQLNDELEKLSEIRLNNLDPYGVYYYLG